ncbi:PAS domain S-box protein [Actinoplanes sp. KI2]|uniref:two-component system sensor histidine kinase NtrB n=1 Tax=Actinoplanes sp. KI2 TaxID=2983315 RepID=UPI0021D5B5B4|nr:PAS domain-containing sensor histidine kinase [Actinoplanes sp. KI2]MCU7725001.1 PAS domain S-box protein [Actinoplanes sp. KI2]
MQTLRRVRAGARLNGLFGLVALLLLIMIGVAVVSVLAQRKADLQVTQSDGLLRDALTAKYRTADFNGWQTGYAFDTIRGVPGATEDAVGQRAQFLASTAAFREDLARISAYPLTPDQRRLLATAEDAFAHFMNVDAQIVAGYRSGTPEAIAAANALVAGEELQWFDKAAFAVDQLAAQAKATADADTAAARAMSSRALIILLVVGAACLLLAVALAVLATRAVAAAARRKATLAAILEQSADATFALTMDGMISAWNSGAEHIYGYTRDEIIGRSASTLLLPNRQGVLASVLSGIGEGRQFHIDEAPRRRKDGSRIYVSTIVWPLRNDEGLVIGGAATERDITARKQREAEQRLADETAARTARLESLGQLAGGVAHDFNNLLAVILNCAELMAEEAGDHAPEDLARIRAAAQRGQDLIGQLLLFAKRDSSQAEVVDLNEVVVEATGLLSRTIGPGITLLCRTRPGVVAVCANRGRLDQILFNLVINARDAMPQGGAITVETSIARLPEDAGHPLPAGSYAQLTVTDTGTGMSAEVKDRIFEPFFSTKPEDRGTGLGLATVYGIVGDAGGTITVESTPGIGTTFRIQLPTADTPPDAECRRPPAAEADARQS